MAHPLPFASEFANQDEIIAAVCDVSKNSADPFGDGDQSLLRAVAQTQTMPGGNTPEATALHLLWCNLGDFMKDDDFNVRGIALAAYWGDVAYIKWAVAWARAGCPAGELPSHLGTATFNALYGDVQRVGSLEELLEGRHCNLRLAPLHCAVLGAKRRKPQAGISPDWVTSAALLVEAGARVASRDILGNTPIMGATMAPYHNADTLV